MGLVSSLNHARKIGSEFEGYILLTASGEPRSAQEALAYALTQNGIPAIARGYSKESLPSHVKVAVEYDASIQPEQKYRGIRWAQIEVKTNILNLQEWEAIVPPMLTLLRYAGLRVNHSTGHHLTLSFAEVNEVANVRSLWNLYHRYQDVLFSLVAPSRRGNTYCRPLPFESKLLHGINSKRALRQRLATYDRYYFLNTRVMRSRPRLSSCSCWAM